MSQIKTVVKVIGASVIASVVTIYFSKNGSSIKNSISEKVIQFLDNAE